MSSTHDDERQAEAYQSLTRLIETPHIDNINILKALIYSKEDQLPLYDGFTKTRASIDVLRRKNVLLFISDLDPTHYERFNILELFYQATKEFDPSSVESMYKIVWLPAVELSMPWDETKQKKFETLQQQMPWYSVFHPLFLDPTVIRYIKEHWHFIKQPLIVVIDSQGKVVNRDGMHMICIWGIMAFPFTSQREEALWKEETWRIELIVDGIQPLILNWIAENKYICLYGGEDMEWIRRFTSTAQAVAREAEIPLEMMYVGKSNPREKVQRNIAIIEEEKLSHILEDLTLIWFFWFRIERMSQSKVQQGVENDPIMEEITKMLRFDESDQGWAMISRGSTEMASAIGDTINQALTEYEVWKVTAKEKGFVNALNDHLNRFDNAIFIEKSNMYLCCAD